MSIAIFSIPLGIISIVIFGYAINKMGDKPASGKKKDDDTAMIEIIVSVVLFFVSLGIFDIKESTAGLYNPSAPQQAERSSERNESKSDAQKEVEEYNKATVEKARSGENDGNEKSNDKSVNYKDAADTTKLDKEGQNKNLEQQQKAYQKWKMQIEARLQSIDTTWSALWIDSPNDIEKLTKALEHEKNQLAEIKIPEELSVAHRNRLNESANRYIQWIDSKLKACQMKLNNSNQNDIVAEVAKGDGLKIRSNVEISAVGRELGLSE